MDKNLELYHEEQRQQLIDLKKSVDNLADVFTEQVDRLDKEPVTDVNVKGSVQVDNLKDDVSVTNIEDIQHWLIDLGTQLDKTIKNNSHKPLSELKVSNIQDAKAESLEITNFDDLKQYFDELIKSIIENKPIVKVQKQDIQFPTNPKQAIPVRLSDGKSFYNAIASAMSGGINTAGLATEAKQDDIITQLQALRGFQLPVYDEIAVTYPTTSSELYTYKLSSSDVATITVTYSDDTKVNLTGVVFSAS